MAKSKYEYVKTFEDHEKCLPNCWIVVRVDGKGFHKFSEQHHFEKPNDPRCLRLMTSAAKGILKEFHDVILAYGQSDEYSFVLRKDTDLYKRRYFKILTNVCSSFTSHFVYNWSKYFGNERLLYPPAFDGRIILYPDENTLRDYLSWRQADVHVNNLYNTCFWNLVLKKHMTNQEAQERLNGTVSSDKNELLFKEFGINYNNEPEMYRKGTTIIRKLSNMHDLMEYTGDIIGQAFWNMYPYLLNPEKKSKDSGGMRSNSKGRDKNTDGKSKGLGNDRGRSKSSDGSKDGGKGFSRERARSVEKDRGKNEGK